MGRRKNDAGRVAAGTEGFPGGRNVRRGVWVRDGAFVTDGYQDVTREVERDLGKRRARKMLRNPKKAAAIHKRGKR